MNTHPGTTEHPEHEGAPTMNTPTEPNVQIIENRIRNDFPQLSPSQAKRLAEKVTWRVESMARLVSAAGVDLYETALHNLGVRALYDAGREHERATTTVDGRPWDPLVRYHPLNVGDEVRQDHLGVTYTGVVGRVDKHGDPWTAEGGLIGLLRNGTWYVRRPQHITPGTWKVDDQ